MSNKSLKPPFKLKPKLKRILEERGLTQTKLSQTASVYQPFISRFDESENYNINYLFAVARALNLSIEDLFDIEYEDEKSQP